MGTTRLSLGELLFILLMFSACYPMTSSANDLAEARAAFDAKDYAKAIRLLTPLAQQGNATAASVLGGLYLEGRGVDRDYAEAFRWSFKAAEQGHPHGQFNLGWLYEKGLGVNQDYSEAVKWYRRSAERGHPQGQTSLGAMYGTGRGLPQDHSEAMAWYRRAAARGYPDAVWRIGVMYAQGEGVPTDYVEAEKWFRRAASQREPHGQLWLGRLYLEGWGVAKSVGEAAKWYKLAVDEFRRAGQPLNAASTDQSASSLLLRALLFPPGDLALSHVAVTHDLQVAQRALPGSTVALSMRAPGDPKPLSVVIDRGNASAYVALFESRIDIYSHAIRQRGFQRLAQQYDIVASDGCRTVDVSPGPAVIDQDDFSLHLATGRFQGTSRHRGTIVESVLVIQHAARADIYFAGDIQPGRIDLKTIQQRGPAPAQLDCVLTLTAR